MRWHLVTLEPESALLLPLSPSGPIPMIALSSTGILSNFPIIDPHNVFNFNQEIEYPSSLFPRDIGTSLASPDFYRRTLSAA
jgi:hypothetical protein